MKQIARAAQVSVSTVSRVLNEQHKGEPVVRERVQQTMKKLGYKARRRSRQGTRRGSWKEGMKFIIHPSAPLGSYGGDILRGAEEEARRNGYILYFSRESSSLSVLGSASDPGEDSGKSALGIIHFGSMSRDFYLEVKQSRIPIVHVNDYPPGEVGDCVMCDNFSASYQAVEWLLGLGHRRIACIACGTPANTSTEERVMGYRQALFDASIAFDPALFQRMEGFSSPCGFEAMKHFARVEPRPTAIFGVVDEVAVGAIQGASAAGLRVPEDLSVVGVNDLRMAQACNPPLTTVRIFRQEMGRVAVRRLIELVRNPAQRPLRINVLCELVERGSCARAPQS